MAELIIKLEGDGSFPELADRKVIELEEHEPITITSLSHGMASGLPSVAFIFKLPDGSYVFAQSSLRLFQCAAAALMARYGDVT